MPGKGGRILGERKVKIEEANETDLLPGALVDIFKFDQINRKAVEEGKRAHKGAVTLDGSMIDKPMELRAYATLAQARAAGISV